VENGVDTDFFSPEIKLDSPFEAGEQPIVFTGAMDYWPNVDAVRWFAERCFPGIRAERPAARFYIVGMNPAKAVLELASRPGIVVTGRVADVRPWLRHACLAVAPLRVARGIQNKVLEAMAMALPVVTTPDCARALSARQDHELAVADDPAQWIERSRALFDPARARAMGQAARRRVLADYGWEQKLAKLDSLMGRSANGDRSPMDDINAGARAEALPA
jgi:sugar transferase (PEP-CTERM/EpsH1 system associated)